MTARRYSEPYRLIYIYTRCYNIERADSAMVSNGQQWSVMVSNGQQWSAMVSNGQQWSAMVSNGQ